MIYSKSKSKALQGIALILMVFHHQFSYAFNHTSVIFGDVFFIEQKLAWFGKICVAVFAFVSGAGIFYTLNKLYNENIDSFWTSSYKDILDRIIKLLMKYWLVLLILIPLLVFKCNIDINSILIAFTTYDTSFNGGWWYIRQYLYMLLLAPALYSILTIFDKNKSPSVILRGGVIFCFIVVFFHFVIKRGTLIYLVIFIEGMVIIKFQLFERLKDYVSNRKFFIGISLLFIVILVRTLFAYSPGYSLIDIFLIVPFVFSLLLLLEKTVILEQIGKMSIWLWLVSTAIQMIFKEEIESLKYTEQIIIIVYASTFICATLFQKIYVFLNNRLIKRIHELEED